MEPIFNLEVLSALPRTLQRWEWERLEGGLVVLGGFVLFVGEPPSRTFRLEVEMYGAGGALIGTSTARLDPGASGWLPVSPVRAEFVTEEEPPYRLRVQFVSEGLPRSRQELMKSAESQIRPWVRRELPSSS